MQQIYRDLENSYKHLRLYSINSCCIKLHLLTYLVKKLCKNRMCLYNKKKTGRLLIFFYKINSKKITTFCKIGGSDSCLLQLVHLLQVCDICYVYCWSVFAAGLGSFAKAIRIQISPLYASVSNIIRGYTSIYIAIYIRYALESYL